VTVRLIDIFIDGDSVEEYYKFQTGENRYSMLYLFRQYYHNMKQQYQYFLFVNKKTIGIFNCDCCQEVSTGTFCYKITLIFLYNIRTKMWSCQVYRRKELSLSS
jgi:hypothetical protein